MTRKVVYLVTILAVVLLLTACGTQLPDASPSTAEQTPAAQGQAAQALEADGSQGKPFDPADQPIEQKLAIGTLKLEGTDLAVTAEQAKALLPLWKAVKALSTSETVSMDEVNAVYAQIQEAMTQEQVTAIKEMSINPEDMQALMDELGIEIEMPAGGERPELSEEQLATMQARREELSLGQAGQGGPGGDLPGGRGMPGGGGMPPMEGGMPLEGGMPAAEGTPMPGMTGPRGAGGGFNTTLVEPLITLLQERAGL